MSPTRRRPKTGDEAEDEEVDDLLGPSNDLAALEGIDLDFFAHNLQFAPRSETISASIPFPEGAIHDLGEFGVPGYDTAWLPLQHWSDGSVRVAQAQIFDSIPANSRATYRVESGQTAVADEFVAHDWVAREWPQVRIGARVRDTFDHKYEAEIAGPGETLQSTALKRVRRWRIYHQTTTGGGIGRDFCASTFYVSEFRDSPFVVIDWVFGNDYQGIDDPAGSSDPNLYPLGPVDIDDVALLTSGFAELRPYRPDWHDVASGVVEPDGRLAHVVINDDWIADGQTQRYRFLGRVEPADAADSELAQWESAFIPFRKGGPVRALTKLPAWQQCRGLGLLGGPLTPPANAAALAEHWYRDWVELDHFGLWQSFGDWRNSNATGTPRNAGLGEDLAHAVQAEDVRLLEILEEMCWAQANRPYHMHGLVVGAEQDIQLWEGVPLALNNRWARDLAPESLGRRALWESDPWAKYRTRVDDDGSPHGWNPYDTSHWSTDLQFEYWTITGDEWAREELRLLGQCQRGMMHYHGYNTNFTQFLRGEGWTMQSYVQVYLATRDQSLKDKAIRRTHDVIAAQRLVDHPSGTLRDEEADDRIGLPGDEYRWYPAWQYGAVFYGYLGAYKFFGDPIFLEICEHSVQSVSYAWVDNYTDPNTGAFVAGGLRYGALTSIDGLTVPVDYFDSSHSIDFSPSTARTCCAGLFFVARWSQDAAVKAEARRIARAMLPTVDSHVRWHNKWAYLVPPDELAWN